MAIEFSRQIFEKCSNIEFYESPFNGSRVFPCGRTDGQTDRYDEASSRFSQFCERHKNDPRAIFVFKIILLTVVIFVCDSLF